MVTFIVFIVYEYFRGTIKGILGEKIQKDHSDQEKFSVSVSPLNVTFIVFIVYEYLRGTIKGILGGKIQKNH